MKPINISELSERITLLSVRITVDSELNRIEEKVPVQTVWAKVEPKNSKYDPTMTGERPEVIYNVTMRKNDNDFVYVRWRDNMFRMLAPKYDVDRKYTVFEMKGLV